VDRSADEVGDLSRAFSDLATRLDREEKVRRDFVATASHELRTPLMTLQGRLELLADELASPNPDIDDGRRQLADARDQADRLGRLAADLLDLSRLDAEVELRREVVDLPELARAVAAEFSARFADNGRQLSVEAERASALADPSASARILRVLLDNALRYSDTAVAVGVAAGTSGGDVSVSVSDGGPGIPEKDRERIFERFTRGPTGNASRGFGLGLAIARELADRMGGSLRVTGNEGAGTTFTLMLPRAPESP
jgi:signal transduction histidine kinase